MSKQFVWITKYALTKGIMLKECEIGHPLNKNWAIAGTEPFTEIYQKGEWFTSNYAALVDAEKRRDSAVVSAQKRLEKLQKMKFELPKLPPMEEAKGENIG